jgi:hypothetical protein
MRGYSIALTFLIWACASSDQEQTLSDNQALEYQTQFKKQESIVKSRIVGKKLDLFQKACSSDSSKYDDGRCLILVIRNSDCTSCLDIGEKYWLSERYDVKNKVMLVTGNKDFIQNRISFKSLLFDEEQRVQNELGYFHSPTFIVYNDELGISDLYFIPTFLDSKGLEDFTQRIK